MVNKEIIIDGADVSECAYYSENSACCRIDDECCIGYPTCYF